MLKKKENAFFSQQTICNDIEYVKFYSFKINIMFALYYKGERREKQSTAKLHMRAHTHTPLCALSQLSYVTSKCTLGVVLPSLDLEPL